MVHWINGPDPEPHLHDHPVTFLSFIVRGCYYELRQRLNGKQGWVRRSWFNFILGSYWDRHRIVDVAPGTVTFCLVGPKTREWGFHTPEGWVYWKDYNADKYKGHVTKEVGR